MAKGQSLSRHQQGIVNRYYEHQDTIVRQRLAEIVSDLALCTSAGKAKGLWKRAATALGKTDVEPARIQKILRDEDVQSLAQLVSELA